MKRVTAICLILLIGILVAGPPLIAENLKDITQIETIIEMPGMNLDGLTATELHNIFDCNPEVLIIYSIKEGIKTSIGLNQLPDNLMDIWLYRSEITDNAVEYQKPLKENKYRYWIFHTVNKTFIEDLSRLDIGESCIWPGITRRHI